MNCNAAIYPQRHESYILEVDILWYHNKNVAQRLKEKLRSPFYYEWIEEFLTDGMQDFVHATHKDFYEHWDVFYKNVEIKFPFIWSDNSSVLTYMWKYVLLKYDKSFWEMPIKFIELITDHI